MKSDSGFNVMAVNKIARNGPEMVFSLHRYPDMSLEVVEVETLLILLENLFDLLLELGVPVSRWVFSVTGLFQIDSFICGWKNDFSIFFGKYHFRCIESPSVHF